ncbi:alternate-type signal peptide domain-containing protein [Sediminivirga luteola]|nr:alternate-type signal peptide domain-containing protein [Sediminivirga luteola]MCI2266657.1 alternate-type signal peptide domain-containing protein [Sediminivirga luteola]
MRKSTAGIIAGAGLLALALTGGTFALWSDDAEADGGIITAGNLQVTTGQPQWYDISAGTDKTIDLNSFRAVPGDTLRLDQDVDVVLVGDNLKAQAAVELPDAGGALAQHLDVTYEFLDAQGRSLGSAEAGQAIETEITPADAGTYTVEVTFQFDENTPDRVATEASAAIAGTTITLTQVR